MIKYIYEIKDNDEVEALTEVKDSNAFEVVDSAGRYIEAMLQTILKNAISEEEKKVCYTRLTGSIVKALLKFKKHLNVNEEEENND